MAPMLAAFLTSLIAFQDPTPTPAPPASEQVPKAQAPVDPPKPIETWDDRTAKAAVDEFAKALKGKPSMNVKNKALEALATGSNKLLLKPLAAIVETDKSVLIRKRAVELIANQPAVEANAAIRKLLKNTKVTTQYAVTAELVRALMRCGYQSAQWNEIGDLFEREYHLDLLQLIETHKEKQAVPMLLRNLDEPSPKNVHAGENPPAEYWEARWKSWAVWRDKVKSVLFVLTGQRFSTEAEAKAWLEKNPLK
jgi:hypothetical protein